MTDLKSCVVCGGKGEVYSYHCGYFVQCECCDLRSEWTKSYGEVVKTWNNQ